MINFKVKVFPFFKPHALECSASLRIRWFRYFVPVDFLEENLEPQELPDMNFLAYII